jgi:hypothetical protein
LAKPTVDKNLQKSRMKSLDEIIAESNVMPWTDADFERAAEIGRGLFDGFAERVRKWRDEYGYWRPTDVDNELSFDEQGPTTMNIIAPVWKLRGLCPVCEQGNCLAFVSCTRCGHLLIVCEEEGSVFGDPRALEPHHGLSSS